MLKLQLYFVFVTLENWKYYLKFAKDSDWSSVKLPWV